MDELRLRRAHAALALAASLLLGCSFTVPRLDPRPNIALVAPAQPKSVALAFAPTVLDRFASTLGNYTMHVERWRASLGAGFHNGFKKVFSETPTATPDFTLQIDEARLEVGDFEHAEARIKYAVTLTGRDGSVRRTAGVASRSAPMYSGSTAYTSDLLDEDISESIAAMYEQIAKELFAPASYSQPPPTPAPAAAVTACVPGQSAACAGPKGCQGFQVCASDGSRYEACSCGN
jgi:hypothetical protein